MPTQSPCHLNLLSELHRDFVLLGFGNVAGDLAGVFVFFAGYLARVCVGAALGLNRHTHSIGHLG